MKRRLPTILSAGSLILCVATVVLGVVSCWRELQVQVMHAFPAGQEQTVQQSRLTSVAGAIAVYRFDGIGEPPEQDQIGWTLIWLPRIPQLNPWTEGLWFAYEANGGPDWRENRLRVPCWFPTALFLIAPVLWLRRFREHRRRQKLGLCLHCAYDLRATHDKCPECGQPIPADLLRKPIT